MAGINNVSGPGMLDFESCFSLEKLVLDNEICGMTLRMAKGIEPKEDFPAMPRFEEMLKEGHLLISDHTRRYLRDEVYFPGPSIDRANRSRWQEEGSLTLGDRAHQEVERAITSWAGIRLSDDIKSEMTKLMEAEACRYGMERLPTIE
ncbi:MAG: trimethylamine methyltransferase family protein [Candidatus Zixiibacteriota bacterium]